MAEKSHGFPCHEVSGGSGDEDILRRELAAAETRCANYGSRLASGDDALGDHLKAMEARQSRRRSLPGLPICVRLDGKSFSGFTKPLARPYDIRMSRAMVRVTAKLVEESGAVLGYTQSDEITLGFWYPNSRTQPYLGGRFEKMATVLAGRATAHFLLEALELFPDAVRRHVPSFDGRAFEVPDPETLAMAFVWREMDATKNSVSMAARAHFPHARLHGKSSRIMREMLLAEKGVEFADYPAFFRRGTYLRRVIEERLLTGLELARIPVGRRPFGTLTRARIAELDMPPMTRVANPVMALLGGEAPVPKEYFA